MRQSKREQILQAATAVVQRDGVTALTYESVAAEAGVTKGGLLYHFPSREQMLHALHQYVAGRWEQAMVDQAALAQAEAGARGHDQAGAPAAAQGHAPTDQLDADARFGAFVHSSQSPDRAELLLMLEASENPATSAVWDQVYQRWAPEPPAADAADDGDLDRFIARLAADGLWLFQSLSAHKLDPEVRARLAQKITALGSRGAR